MRSALPHVLITLLLLATALIYSRGWIRLRRTLPDLVSASRLAEFLGGLALLWIAMASPLAALDGELLTVHMLQHLLIMTVAAPLILLGAPVVTLLHGLPQRIVRVGFFAAVLLATARFTFFPLAVFIPSGSMMPVIVLRCSCSSFAILR